MAGRPRKNINETADSAEIKNTALAASYEKSVEDSSLKEENEKLKAQLQEVLNKLSSLESKTIEDIKSKNKTVNTDNDEYKDINPLKSIKVISLTDGGVSLRTNASGSGKIFRFDKFGHSISITYSDLQDVIATDRTLIEDGTVYICDSDVVKNNYLDEYYRKFLTVDTITNILSFNTDDIADMVSNTTESIQETIISLIVKKINNNEYVDMNKVNIIGKSCKVPCDIASLAMQKRAN